MTTSPRRPKKPRPYQPGIQPVRLPQFGRRIEEVYAFVYTGPDGADEIVRVGMHHTHLIAGDLDTARQLAPTAQQFADRTGNSFRLVKFTARTDVTELLR